MTVDLIPRRTSLRRLRWDVPANQAGARAAQVAQRSGRTRGGQSDPAQIQDLSAAHPGPEATAARTPHFVRWKPQPVGRSSQVS
jgi:hypothetical protein